VLTRSLIVLGLLGAATSFAADEKEATIQPLTPRLPALAPPLAARTPGG
jgi:hypothetical protein